MHARKTVVLSLVFMMAATACANVATDVPLSSSVATDVSAPTAQPPMPEPPTAVPLNVSADVKAELDKEHVLTPDGMVNTALLHSETAKDVTIVPESITVTPSNDTSVPEIITGKDAAGTRYIWNVEVKGWVLDVVSYMEWTKPDASPYLEQSAWGDGTANIIKALYVTEHPSCIPENAPHPYYKVNVFFNGIMISLYRYNHHLWKDAEETQVPLKLDALPYAMTGIIQTKDSKGNIIYVLSQVKSNPTAENPKQTENVFFGFDKATYDEIVRVWGPDTINFLAVRDQLVAYLPLPAGTSGFDPSSFAFPEQSANPAVAGLQNQNEINMFTEDEQKQILAIVQAVVGGKIPSNFSTPDHPMSVAISQLPPELSYMIVYPAYDGWEISPQ